MQKETREKDEEVRIQMTKWNNLIIKQEKMHKLRIEIDLNIDTDQEKLNDISKNLEELINSIGKL